MFLFGEHSDVGVLMACARVVGASIDMCVFGASPNSSSYNFWDDDATAPINPHSIDMLIQLAAAQAGTSGQDWDDGVVLDPE